MSEITRAQQAKTLDYIADHWPIDADFKAALRAGAAALRAPGGELLAVHNAICKLVIAGKSNEAVLLEVLDFINARLATISPLPPAVDPRPQDRANDEIKIMAQGSSTRTIPDMANTLPRPVIGDVVVSKFGNHWTVVSVGEPGVDDVTLHNVPPEYPSADGTTRVGAFPEWADHITRNGIRVWQRPTPKCECPSFANAKGPYPSGFCPDCKRWYPGIDSERAVAFRHASQTKTRPQESEKTDARSDQSGAATADPRDEGRGVTGR